jgi:hypothetical protein
MEAGDEHPSYSRLAHEDIPGSVSRRWLAPFRERCQPPCLILLSVWT